jgi:hypothetical protein
MKYLLTVYALGGIAVFVLHKQLPVTLGLAVVRSLLWPIWVCCGWQHGTPLPMD